MVATPEPPLRLFLALWPDAAVRDALVAWQQCWCWPARAAPVRPQRLHLTLHFLGDVPARRLPAMRRGLRSPFETFELQLGRAELWPGGMAVLQPSHPPPALVQLHASLGEALRRLEVPVESRPFRPHVTLARRAAGATLPPQGLDLRWRVDGGYVLVRSLPDGAGYDVLQRFGA